jgi:hypothetical protein
MSARPLAARHALTVAASAVTCALLSGCFTSVVKSGAPAAAAPIEYDEKWHSGIIYGIAELSGPYDLSRICPNGWAEIKTETSFVNGLVQALTFSIYNPQTVTVRCAAGPIPAPGPAMTPAAAGALPAPAAAPPDAIPPPAAPPPAPPPPR